MIKTDRYEINASKVISINDDDGIKGYVDFAGIDNNNNLIVIGWVFDIQNLVDNFSLIQNNKESFLKKGTYQVHVISSNTNNVLLKRVIRKDVSEALSSSESEDILHGFLIVIKDHDPEEIIALKTKDGRYLYFSHEIKNDISEIKNGITNLWPHSGSALKSLLIQCLDRDNELLRFVMELDAKSINKNSLIKNKQVFAIDHALLFDEQAIILNGWIGKPDDQIFSIDLYINNIKIPVTTSLKRYFRVDLVDAFPWSKDKALGFIFLLTNQSITSFGYMIVVTFTDRSEQIIEGLLTDLEWSEMPAFINNIPAASKLLLSALSDAPINDRSQDTWSEQITKLQRIYADVIHSKVKKFESYPDHLLAAIDYGFALNNNGILFFGWACLLNSRKLKSIKLLDAQGAEIDVSSKLFPLIRKDVVSAYKSQLNSENDMVGFSCFVPLPTTPGEPRALSFDFGEFGKCYVKIPTDKVKENSSLAIKEILRLIPDPNQMKFKLYELFESGLGNALELINNNRIAAPETKSREFGQPNISPELSVLIPLFGRFDFLRFQLAQFADDADFKKTDLIYIVDDPSILTATLELAAKYQPLFNIPFRVVWNGENRGFAAANNLGASVAKGDYLVLLNSDVIPQHNGWLTTLKNALNTLPKAGVVAPLLQFGDDSIQHAGMYPRQDPLLPGFLLNTHKSMGMPWDSSANASTEHPMLTAACLMLRTDEYKKIGGLDEGYVLGDFEDADLCMMLRKHGHKLYLVPEAKLWHLERQSQNLNDIADVRQLITLFNGWRFLNKIKMGIIPAPTNLEAIK